MIAAVTAPEQGQDSRVWPFAMSPCHSRTYLTVTVILRTSASQLSGRAEVIDIGRVSTRARTAYYPLRGKRAHVQQSYRRQTSGEAEQES